MAERSERARPRYAFYFVPPRDDPLYAFGSSVLGYDIECGTRLDFPQAFAGGGLDWPALTAEPRRYGFHATLKPPFELTDGATETTLIERAEEFASQRSAFELAPLDVEPLVSFAALVPSQPSPELVSLAADCVTGFDGFRAALSDADRRRRPLDTLTARQRSHLDRWGYPWVLDEFRFHMTLTGPLPPAQAEAVLAQLRRLHRPLRAPLAVNAITLVRQPSRTSGFVVIKRIQFAR